MLPDKGKMLEVQIGTRGHRLTGSLAFPDKENEIRPAVLLSHGCKSGQDSHLARTQALADSGLIALAITLRGYRGSRENHLQDLIAAYDFLAERPQVDRTRIGVFGAGYWGYLATILSAERDVRWLALWEPFLYRDDNFTTSTAELIRQDQNVFRQTDLGLHDNLALRAISRFIGDLLLIQSEQADVVPHRTMLTYQRAVGNPTSFTCQTVEGADHALSQPQWEQGLTSILYHWFTTRLKSTPEGHTTSL